MPTCDIGGPTRPLHRYGAVMQTGRRRTSALLVVLVLAATTGCAALRGGAGGDPTPTPTGPPERVVPDKSVDHPGNPDWVGPVDESGGRPYFLLRADLREGDCIEGRAAQPDLSDAVVVPCTTPHLTEVMYLHEAAPDVDRIIAEEDCWAKTDPIPGFMELGISWSAMPDPNDHDTPHGYCLFEAAHPVTGSFATDDVEFTGAT